MEAGGLPPQAADAKPAAGDYSAFALVPPSASGAAQGGAAPQQAAHGAGRAAGARQAAFAEAEARAAHQEPAQMDEEDGCDGGAEEGAEAVRKSGRAPKPKQWSADLVDIDDVPLQPKLAPPRKRFDVYGNELPPARRKRPRQEAGELLLRPKSDLPPFGAAEADDRFDAYEPPQPRRRPGGGGRDRDRDRVRNTSFAPPPAERERVREPEFLRPKERAAAWDARMHAGLSAMLSRLLCSRSKLEAAWLKAPGVSGAAMVMRAVHVIPVLRPRVQGICAALDKSKLGSMQELLDLLREACSAACKRCVAEGIAAAAELAPPPALVAPPPSTLMPFSLGADLAPAIHGLNGGAAAVPSVFDEPFVLAPEDAARSGLNRADKMRADADWLFEALRTVLRATELVVSQGYTFPDSITQNREPYVQAAEWQTKPYARRPYVRLVDYQIPHIMTDGLGDEVNEIAAKLRAGGRTAGCSGDCCNTRKQLGGFSLLAGRFVGACACLNGSQECGPLCACAQAPGGCMNSKVSRRQTLQLGVHVTEQDVWGMDCYTRRNVQDAIRDAHLLDTAPEGLVNTWIEHALLPAINAAGPRGWDVKSALRGLHARARAAGDRWSASAAAAVASRVSLVGRVYFRTHPKGCGIVCIAPGGIPAQTFVEEYFGEVHPPWRWFEKQDALKRRRRAGDLPDFYNICLDRPKDDPGGFDVLFVDAAPAGSFASRLSHSCQPNCQAVVMSAGGRLTIAVYTLRWIAKGEELTFDYSSVTESDAEYRAAVCLCGTSGCRGSFLTWTGSSSFQQVMALKHTFVDRNALLVRAGVEALTAEDHARLDRWAVRSCVLGGADGAYAAPQWLVKWASLTLEFIEQERDELPAALVALNLGYSSHDVAREQARGVAESRLQNLVFTIDKVKHVLRQPGQPQSPPLRMLSEAETAAALWSAPDSVARRLLDTAASHLCSACRATCVFAGEHDTPGCQALLRLQTLCEVPEGQEEDRGTAVKRLLEMEDVLRGVDTSKPAGGRHAAAADLAHFYASTQHFFTSERYNSVMSDPVTLREEEVGWQELPVSPSAFWNGGCQDGNYGLGARSANAAAAAAAAAASAGPGTQPAAVLDEAVDGDAPENEDDWWVTDARTAVRWVSPGSGGVVPREDPVAAEAVLETPASPSRQPPPAATPMSPLGGIPARSLIEGGRASVAPPPAPVAAAAPAAGDSDAGADDGAAGGNAPARAAVLSPLQEVKKYRSTFIWGQLTGWFKQTVLDPTASLSADRRGTISLPDVDSCYGKYSLKDRAAQLALVSDSPGAMWPAGTLWSFKNTGRLYGSPMLDAAIARSRKEETVLPQIIAQLMAHGVAVPAGGAPHAAAQGDGKGGGAESAQPAAAHPAEAEAGIDDKF